jgi:hypothetical protein
MGREKLIRVSQTEYDMLEKCGRDIHGDNFDNIPFGVVVSELAKSHLSESE